MARNKRGLNESIVNIEHVVQVDISGFDDDVDDNSGGDGIEEEEKNKEV